MKCDSLFFGKRRSTIEMPAVSSLIHESTRFFHSTSHKMSAIDRQSAGRYVFTPQIHTPQVVIFRYKVDQRRRYTGGAGGPVPLQFTVGSASGPRFLKALTGIRNVNSRHIEVHAEIQVVEVHEAL